jgi:uncharacterized protein (DUF2235 family)
MKRILVCLDGTWNSSGKEEAGSDTNVLKLYRMAHKHDGASQVSGYFSGVGTARFERVTGGVFGFGLYDQIKDGYRFIVNEYQPGDQVIIVGFSRGAFSARCLAGFVAKCGVLKEHVIDVGDFRDRRAINDLWDLFKERNERPAALAEYCQKKCYPLDPRTVAAVGVWDTVGSLGIPWEVFESDKFAARLNDKERRLLAFLDTELPAGVAKGYHAVALDEQRVPFEPTLWTGPRLIDGSIHQVWFAGSHSNVGGGFASTGLSDIALDWMIHRLRASHGLDVDSVIVKPDGVWQAVDFTSMDKAFGKLPGEKVKLLKPRQVPVDSRLHPTADLRLKGTTGRTPIPTHASFLGSFRVDPVE